MTNKKDLIIMAHLRQNARTTLTTMSRRTQIPVSTLFDKLRTYEGREIERYISLLNFQQLGYHTRAFILLRVHKNDKERVRALLEKSSHVNCLFKINNGYDFQFESIFRDMSELEVFLEQLESQFKIRSKEVHYVIEDIKREAFLSDPQLVDAVVDG